MVKPVPEIDAELTVSAVVPEEVSATDWVVGVFRAIVPKLSVLVLSVN